MIRKNLTVGILTVTGIYFLLFHSSPFPFSHDAIGLPPFHVVHATLGVLLLCIAGYVLKKKQ